MLKEARALLGDIGIVPPLAELEDESLGVSIPRIVHDNVELTTTADSNFLSDLPHPAALV